MQSPFADGFVLCMHQTEQNNIELGNACFIRESTTSRFTVQYSVLQETRKVSYHCEANIAKFRCPIPRVKNVCQSEHINEWVLPDSGPCGILSLAF
jgi:hypothetical protein